MYRLYLFYIDVLQKVSIYEPNINCEIKKIFGDWLLEVNTEIEIRDKIIYKSTENFSLNLQKNYISECVLEKVLFMVNQFNNQTILKYNYNVKFKGGNIIYENFKYSMSAERLDFLREYGDENVLKMILKNYIISEKRLVVPLFFYKKLVELYNIDVEGFASPIDSQLIILDKKNKFCSLLPEVDNIFGSIGNFFAAKLEGHRIAINPLFDEYLMEKICLRIFGVLKKKKKTLFIFFSPIWKNFNFYKLLLTSKYLVDSYVFEQDQFYFEKLNKTKINYRISLFILANYKIQKNLIKPDKIGISN